MWPALFLPYLLAIGTCQTPQLADPLVLDAPPLVGYLGAFFLGNAPDIFFYLSNGNEAFSYKALNGGKPVLTPTLGTGGVRDPSIIEGGGQEYQKKWYIIGTDLDISKTTWDASQRKGSLSIFVWESTDLITWENERLVKVEDDTAGMVWAPDAIWDLEKRQYLVWWASKFYKADDPDHVGESGPSEIRYAYTSDFITFTAPQTYISAAPTSLIDLAIVQTGGPAYARFLKNESSPSVYMELSQTGLFGTWTRPGGEQAIIETGVEGPYAWRDNKTPLNINLLLDYYGGDGLKPFISTDVDANAWVPADAKNFPKGLRHGSVTSLTQDKYDALNAKWG
ncbi:uncharacterized protein L3040_007295 [Drepanopeziza brunnea f. sp. 'multigermtubi']|uniref:Arabinosidase n=1 Tax=Marssonina brunnea f. sp. multigermtubi (strain MB_m1) TaxID=1072389 RepID=K1X5B3_MARBU|nr:arabinosidase [Drepanopeziza brunnea f. sp. 'multigermtubi' MB_m1]EKD20287.1 arabinosidase [Drepanopeziza brunnea f. sp. 'multigermtubi' MB_m1]KAJ5038434.1 hypothetical protein L3040_007295 [Drepanopeziza brunnea f. sp. 'multigermtubi']